MSKSTDHVVTGVTIINITRLKLSSNGNPRFRITFDSGLVAKTQSDASINYGIENPEYQNVPLDVTLTRAGKMTYAKPSAK